MTGIFSCPLFFRPSFPRSFSYFCRRALVLFFIILLIFPFPAAGEEKNRNILILDSFFPGYEWSESVRSGMMNEFEASGKTNLSFYVEFLDVLRAPGDENLQILRRLFRERYTDRGISFDVILCSDDDALDFLVRYRDELFGSSPVVFCGANNFTPSRLQGQKNFTGINEGISLGETLQSILTLFPKTKTIAAVMGVWRTDWLNSAIEKERADLLLKGIRFHYFKELEPEELASRLAHLPENSAILYINYFATPKGKIFTLKEGVDFVKKASKAPLFGFWDSLLPRGIVGGKVVHGRSQGEAAARLALEILSGKKAGEIPVIMDSPNRYVFNGEALERYGILEKELPPGSEVVFRTRKRLQENWEAFLEDTVFGYDLFEEHGSIMLLIDPATGTILDGNKAARNFYGYPTLRGKNVGDLNLSPPAEIHSAMQDARLRKKNHFIFRHRLADGAIRDMEAVSYPVEIQGREYLFSINTDITEALADARAVDNRNRWLFGVVALALALQTAGIFYLYNNIRRRRAAEEKLRSAVLEAEEQRKTATEANRAKSEFLAKMSHEIRTPLNGVIGFVDLLADTPLDDLQRSYAENVRTSARSLMDIVSDVLDISKIEAEKFEPAPLPVDLSALAEEAVRIISPGAEKKGLQLSFHAARKLPRYALVDPLRLKQILVNLLGNAVKFTEAGSVGLTVDFIPLDEKKGAFTFSVQDTGPGIPEENLEKLASAFWQSDSSNTRKFGGVGLGLAITSGLLKKMGSSLEIESVLSEGSRFYFTLETEYYRENPLPEKPLPVRTALPPIRAIPAPKILLAEDTTLNRWLVRNMITAVIPDAVVLEAENGEEAVELFKQEHPHLVLMDLQMPLKDGYEATREIREFEKSNGALTPVVALTADAQPETRDASFALGMNEFLTKPVETKTLRALLAAYLDAERVKRAEIPGPPLLPGENDGRIFLESRSTGIDLGRPAGAARH